MIRLTGSVTVTRALKVPEKACDEARREQTFMSVYGSELKIAN